MHRTVIGIDPGLSGGIAVMDVGERGESLDIVVHPMFTKPGAKSGNDIDGAALASLLRLSNSIKVDIGVEIVHSMPKQGVVSTFNFGKGYGRILGVIEALEMPYREVRPRDWQKIVLDGLGSAGDTKNASIRFCLNAFPKVNFKATERCKNYHDGMTDATCIAEYLRRILYNTDRKEAKDVGKKESAS